MANFEKYLNEQGKNKSMKELVKLAFEEGFEEGLDMAMDYVDDPGELGGRVQGPGFSKYIEKKYKEFLRNNKIDLE